MATVIWPDKDEREDYEINSFINHYVRLPTGRELEIVEKRERPDYFVRDKRTHEHFGVELTSAYLSDSAVPDEHIPVLNAVGIGEGIDFDRSEIDEYKRRLIEKIRDKAEKARTGYDLTHPLILSFYINEYRAIFMDRREWERVVKDYEDVFDSMAPFAEVVFWNLANNEVLSVKPSKKV